MAEFWESNFKDKQSMWGYEPADVAVTTLDFFQKKGFKNILIPGFGYGRNAKIFSENGFNVTGIEISKTAINIATKQFDKDIKIYHGSVTEMPFDTIQYDGIFCYALIHLLNQKDRAKLISDCFNQLKPGGYMVFVAISTSDRSYGKGKLLDKDLYLTKHGVALFFYNEDSITEAFKDFGLMKTKEISEPTKHVENKQSQIFWEIVCKKPINL
ncbi:class I SAM-dependent methyltransferase [Formosa haliotis]|uniref:class I SAM-dependent methyltransferase n=1 Tax=Formosa haliotis TaxID=1555194 RepID=UPI0008240493|nr:class I SAM-dependent methyltransferase [Formosa haliotis]